MSSESKFSNLEGPERLIGTRVLEFELTAVLGAGGMSVVYRARHRVTLQEVAIKILPPELAVHDELKARFVEEARVLARLEHPNIVSLNNFCEAGGRLCLIMQFVEGVTFERQILDAGKLPWRDVLRVGVEVLKALEYAHEQKVVHRDIKPSNVIVRSDSVVKVTDFGIARILGASRLTSTGQTMGTVRYMSPEQVRGKSVDARSDLYSLAVTLYEGLTGRTPFEGENQFDIMQQHLNRKPPAIASMGATVPATVERALGRALEKDVRERYQTASEMRVALEAELQRTDEGKPLKPPSRARSRALAFGLASVVAVVVGGAGVLVLRRPGAPDRADRPGSSGQGVAHGAQGPSFLAPHQLAGLQLAVDETFVADGLRVQSVAPRNAAVLRDRYRELERALAEFAVGRVSPEVQKALGAPPAPLTVVVVPQTVLDRADLWPEYEVKADVTYPSRYVPQKRTLFVVDEPDFERRDLPYGVALHAFARIPSLTNSGILSLAEKFEAYYNARGRK